MQSDQRVFPQKPVGPVASRLGGFNIHDAAVESFIPGTVLPPGGTHSFQSSQVCPKKFIIFDQTRHHNQILFHPAVAPTLCSAGLDVYPPRNQDNVGACNEVRETTTWNEDSNDINVLLSLDDEQEELDGEEKSTARTNENYESDSSDTGSSYVSKSRKIQLPSSEKSGSSSCCRGERKRQKMRTMVETLKGIVPGGHQMNSVTVLDEAVRYLKSLNVEAQKLGVRNRRS